MGNETDKTKMEPNLSECFFDNEIQVNKNLSVIKIIIFFSLFFLSFFVAKGQTQNSDANVLLINEIKNKTDSIELKLKQNIDINLNDREDFRIIFSEIKTLTNILSKLNPNYLAIKEINNSNEISNNQLSITPILNVINQNLLTINNSLSTIASNQNSKILNVSNDLLNSTINKLDNVVISNNSRYDALFEELKNQINKNQSEITVSSASAKPINVVVKMPDSLGYQSSKIENSKEVIIALNNIKNQLKELKNINVQLHELNKNIKERYIINTETDFLEIIKWIAFYVILFFVIIYVSRLLRYYIKLTQHYKDRKLAYQLKEEIDCSIEEALMITSTAYIDFKVPKMPNDILTQYFINKNKKDCCCCCCKKCNCDEKSETKELEKKNDPHNIIE